MPEPVVKCATDGADHVVDEQYGIVRRKNSRVLFCALYTADRNRVITGLWESVAVSCLSLITSCRSQRTQRPSAVIV